MRLPDSDEYNMAVQNPNTCFSDGDLKYGQVQVNNLGLPMPYSGGFTTTYKISNGNLNYAVRCFTRNVSSLSIRYQAIDAFIDNKKSDYLVEARYLKLGMRVNGKWAPIIKMKWVDGDLLNVYIEKIVAQGKEAIIEFLDKFEKLIEKMEEDKIAHGDLQHGNIIVRNDKIFLIDYDGLYLPELEKLGTGEIGHPNYQHPQRTTNCFDGKIDRFAALTIYLSVKALMIEPKLWKKYYNSENILFKKDDFINPKKSELFYDLVQIPELKEDVQFFAAICKDEFENIPSLKDFIYSDIKYTKVVISKPYKNIDSLSQEGVDTFVKLYGGSISAKTSGGSFNYKPTTTIPFKTSPLGGHVNINAQPPASSGRGCGGILHAIVNAIGKVVKAILYFIIISSVLGLFVNLLTGSNNSTTNTAVQAPVYIAPTPIVCSAGMVKSETSGICITRDTDCMEKSGVNSEWDGNYCNCKEGFVWNNSDLSKATACIKCSSVQCVWNGKCIPLPSNGHCVTSDSVNAWLCNEGYDEVGLSCVKPTPIPVIEDNRFCNGVNYGPCADTNQQFFCPSSGSAYCYVPADYFCNGTYYRPCLNISWRWSCPSSGSATCL